MEFFNEFIERLICKNEYYIFDKIRCCVFDLNVKILIFDLEFYNVVFVWEVFDYICCYELVRVFQWFMQLKNVEINGGYVVCLEVVVLCYKDFDFRL